MGWSEITLRRSRRQSLGRALVLRHLVSYRELRVSSTIVDLRLNFPIADNMGYVGER
jgi:hypothetical protein